MKVTIVLAGPRGKMGTEAIKMIHAEEKFQLVACIDRKNGGKSLRDIMDESYGNIPIYEDAKQCFLESKPDVFIDLTVPDAGFIHTKLALQANVKSVVGTSGFSNEQIEELTNIAEQNK